MSETKWSIRWQSMLTGFSGGGKAIFPSRKDALEHCKAMNLQFPDISHWPHREDVHGKLENTVCQCGSRAS